MMDMVNEIYKLYKETLPDIVRNEEIVKAILGSPHNHIVRHEVDGRLAGVSVIGDNTIYLICVGKLLQGKGIGTALLKESEAYIASAGFDKVVLGAGKEYIMPGASMNHGFHRFFEKRGYTHAWGDTRCIDMGRALRDFQYSDHSVGDTINGITYRWAAIGDLDGILKSLSDNEEDFSAYYRNEDYYKEASRERVLIAEKDGEVVGTLAVFIESAQAGMGSLAFTATPRRHRNKGIATTLVALASRYVKDIGMEGVHGSYTYSGLIGMYSRAGLDVCMDYFMGEKTIGGKFE